MASIIRHTFDQKTITAQIVDNEGYLWIAFDKNDEGNCILIKSSPYNPSRIYYTVEVGVEKIVDLFVDDDYIYFACEDPTRIGGRYSLDSPLLTYHFYDRRNAWDENPISLTSDGNYLFFLLPGNISATNALVLRRGFGYGGFDQVLDLQESGDVVTNATGIVYHNDNIWVVSNTTPGYLVRIYFDGTYVFTITPMLGD